MKINPISLLLDNTFKPSAKFYFVSGNEITLMQKIKSRIIEKIQENEKVQIKNIDTIIGFVEEIDLFENKNLFLVDGFKGINEESLNNAKDSHSSFIFLSQNSTKNKKIKNLFNKDKDSYVIDCYELDRDSKIKILNKFLSINKLNISQKVYWFLIDRLDNKYIFFENDLMKISELGVENLSLENVKKTLSFNDSGKEKVFFNLLKKNKEIVELYRERIINNSDVNDVYYHSKFFCQLIIDCNSEKEYSEKIPIYLFKEKNYLIDLFRKYNSKKKKLLIDLLSSTEKLLRKESGLSLVAGLRFLLNIKKITIS